MEMLGVSVRKMKTLTVNKARDTDWLRQNLTCFVYQVYEINGKIFFSWQKFYFDGAGLRFGQIHFSLADMFYLEGRLRLESSCIWVHAVVWNRKGRHNTVWQIQTSEIQVIKNRMHCIQAGFNNEHS